MGRCYETSDGRWYGTEQLPSVKSVSFHVLVLHIRPDRADWHTWIAVFVGASRIIIMMPFREEYYWPRFCKALEKSEWIEAEKYATPSLRGKQATPLSILSTWQCASFRGVLQFSKVAGLVYGRSAP